MALLARSAYDEDHEDFRTSVRRFLEDQLVGELDAWRAAGRFDARVLRAAGEQGFLGTTVPEEFGGGGLADPRFAAVLVEEVVRTGAAGLALVLARQVGACVPALLRLLDSPEKQAWLEGLAAGELTCCVVAPAADLTAPGVPGAGLAGLFLVVDPGQLDRYVVVPREALEVRDSMPLLGGADSAAADVVLDPATLAAHPSVEDPDGLLRRDLDLWSAVVSVAGAEAALDLTRGYVLERKVFGRPIAEFENTRFRLAELGAELAAARCLLDAGLDALESDALTTELAAATRLLTAQVHDRCVDQGMQLHGGYGYMREYPISHAFGDARFLRVAAAMASEPRERVATALGL